MSALVALLAIYAGTSALGMSIRLGWVGTKSWLWIHHGLFALIWIALGVVVASSIASQTWPALTSLACAPFLVLLPRFRPGSAKHCWTAAGGLAALVAAVVISAATG